MSARGLQTASSSRIEALRQKHAALSARIEEVQGRPSTPDTMLRQLKKQKLVLKEELEEIRKTGSGSG
jgi:hypothetical protein